VFEPPVPLLLDPLLDLEPQFIVVHIVLQPVLLLGLQVPLRVLVASDHALREFLEHVLEVHVVVVVHGDLHDLEYSQRVEPADRQFAFWVLDQLFSFEGPVPSPNVRLRKHLLFIWVFYFKWVRQFQKEEDYFVVRNETTRFWVVQHPQVQQSGDLVFGDQSAVLVVHRVQTFNHSCHCQVHNQHVYQDDERKEVEVRELSPTALDPNFLLTFIGLRVDALVMLVIRDRHFSHN